MQIHYWTWRQYISIFFMESALIAHIRWRQNLIKWGLCEPDCVTLYHMQPRRLHGCWENFIRTKPRYNLIKHRKDNLDYDLCQNTMQDLTLPVPDAFSNATIETTRSKPDMPNHLYCRTLCHDNTKSSSDADHKTKPKPSS